MNVRAFLIWPALALAVLGAAEPVHRRFKEIDTLFANPGKGIMAGGRLPRGEPRFPCSIAYFRLNWGDLEPAEGRIRWQLIDESLRAWQARGARIAFRIMTTNAHSAGYYCSPKWLFDAGCRSFEYVRGGEDTMSGGTRISRIEPDYADPIYLEKHGAFLRALAKRYDGNPGIEFLDIGSYGIWGEWHTSHPASLEVRTQIIDWYVTGFTKTPLVMMSDDAEALAYALARGTGFRRDGVGSPWHERNWIGSKKYASVAGFGEAWRRAPVVFEWFGPFDFIARRGWSFERGIAFMLQNHVTCINDNIGKVPPEAMAKLTELARRSGYRFVLRELDHPEAVARGGEIDLRMLWSNVGVGKLYRRFPLTFYLLDESGTPVQTVTAAADPRTWFPGDHRVTERIQISRRCKPGTYHIAVAFADETTGAPAIQIAIDAPEKDRRYTVSTITVK